jgi:hypothetical protein
VRLVAAVLAERESAQRASEAYEEVQKSGFCACGCGTELPRQRHTSGRRRKWWSEAHRARAKRAAGEKA